MDKRQEDAESLSKAVENGGRQSFDHFIFTLACAFGLMLLTYIAVDLYLSKVALRLRNWTYFVLAALLLLSVLSWGLYFVRRKYRAQASQAFSIAALVVLLSVVIIYFSFIQVASSYRPDQVIQIDGQYYIVEADPFEENLRHYYSYVNFLVRGKNPVELPHYE